MKILALTDKPNSAISRLVNSVVKYNPHLDIQNISLHPKRPDIDQISKVIKAFEKCDILFVAYWKSGEKLKEYVDITNKPKILWHHNPYNIRMTKKKLGEGVSKNMIFQKNADGEKVPLWNEMYDEVVCHTKSIHNMIPYAHYIPQGIDLDFWEYNKNYTENKTVLMVAARIEGKKGIREVAQVCKGLDYKFILVGRVSNMDYFNEIKKINPDIDFRENITDEKLKDTYYESAITVCNSVENFECYDDKTEILTDQGWKLFKNLDKTEKIATLNQESQRLEYQKPIKYTEYGYDGDLYYVENRSINFAVTPNHKMYVSTYDYIEKGKKYWTDYQLKEIQDMPSQFKIKRNCIWDGTSSKDINWFRFMGMYLADGCVDKNGKSNYQINIAAVKKRKRRQAKWLFNQMGFKYNENKSGFNISNQKELCKYLAQFGTALKKYVPSEILMADSYQINEFLDWYTYCDGRTHNNARIIFTSSKRMADNLQECFIKVGNNANISMRDRRGKIWIKDHWANRNGLSYTVYEKVKKRESWIRKGMDIEIRKYKGKVFCVQVSNQVILVRRDNKAMFCGNSGPLPILESMACGTPVLTRNVGHVPELKSDKYNMVIREGDTENVEDLKKELKDLMDNSFLREKIRGNAWNTAKNRYDKLMARQFEQLFYALTVKDKDLPFCSVIVPTRNRPEVLIKCLSKIVMQDYKHFEIVIVDSSDESNEFIVKEIKKQTKIPIKYIHFQAKKDEYTLAKARNLGVLESVGKLLVFCDERIGMSPSAISEFINHWNPNYWLYGMKDDAKKGFVENFSCVERRPLIKKGMFNERIDCYGGMSQEIRERFSGLFQFVLVNKAKAYAVFKTSSRHSKKKEIIKAKYILYKLYGHEA